MKICKTAKILYSRIFLLFTASIHTVWQNKIHCVCYLNTSRSVIQRNTWSLNIYMYATVLRICLYYKNYMHVFKVQRFAVSVNVFSIWFIIRYFRNRNYASISMIGWPWAHVAYGIAANNRLHMLQEYIRPFHSTSYPSTSRITPGFLFDT